jgi:hypothetical protein
MLWVSFQEQFIISNPLLILQTSRNTLEHDIKENQYHHVSEKSLLNFWVIKYIGRRSYHYTHQHCEDPPSYFTWHQAHWVRGKALNLYSGGAQFESWRGYWLSWLSFSSLSSVLPGKCQNSSSWLDQDHFLSNPFQFITHSSIHNIV